MEYDPDEKYSIHAYAATDIVHLLGAFFKSPFIDVSLAPTVFDMVSRGLEPMCYSTSTVDICH